MRNIVLLLSVVLLTLTSCQEKGCNDPDALNYEDSVNKDDGSCVYEAYLVFLNSQDTQTLIDQGGEVTVTLEGVIYPSTDFDQMNEVLNCAAGRINVSLGSQKERNFNYSVLKTDSAGVGILSGDQLNLTGNACFVVKI